MRHADAGYEDAIACAKQHGLRLPSLDLGGETAGSAAATGPAR
jgi:urocanate hydratase